MHRFFLDQKLDKEILFIKERTLVHQLKNVLRLRKGERVAFCNTDPELVGVDIIAELKNIEGSAAVFIVRDRVENQRESSKKLTLYCAFLKKDKFEWVLQKGTEVGVSEFVPVIAARLDKKSFK